MTGILNMDGTDENANKSKIKKHDSINQNALDV